MARYVLVEEDSGCCNLVIWDFLLTLAAVGIGVYYGFDKALHPAWCFVIGLVSAIVLVALMNIRILGKIIQILLSAFWAMVAVAMLASFFELDTLWKIVIFVVLTILFIGVHLVSLEEMGIGSSTTYGTPAVVLKQTTATENHSSQINHQLTQLTQRYQNLQDQRETILKQALQLMKKQQNTALQDAVLENERIWKEGSAKLSESAKKLEHLRALPEIYGVFGVMRDYLDKMEASNETVRNLCVSNEDPQISSAGGFDLFAGCDTLEKLEQRYRQLAKSFHPDTGAGDTQSMQYINAEYERRKQELKR